MTITKDGLQQKSCSKRAGGRGISSQGRALLCHFEAPTYDCGPCVTRKEVLFAPKNVVDPRMVEPTLPWAYSSERTIISRT
jgi:hypothetical protein